MKKKDKTQYTRVSQYCLEADPVIKFVKKLNPDIKIQSLRYRGNYNTERVSMGVSKSMKDCGVISAIEMPKVKEIRGEFKTMLSHEKIVSNMKLIGRNYGIDENRFYITHVVLISKDGASSLTFRRALKALKLPNDKRRFKRVLGLEKGDGADYHSMLADLSAHKYTCTFGKTEKTIIMCSQEAVVK